MSGHLPSRRAARDPSAPSWSRINQWLLWIGLAAAVAWLFFRHGEHLSQLLPFLLILACPLMHLFGHGSHAKHRRHEGAGAAGARGPEAATRDERRD